MSREAYSLTREGTTEGEEETFKETLDDSFCEVSERERGGRFYFFI